MRPVDLEAIAEVSHQLNQLGVEYAFTGGAVVRLLLDNPKLINLRPTDDVDAIAAVVNHLEYTKLEEALRGLDFKHDMSEGAPPCRFLYNGIKVDVMPARDTTGRFSDQWFEYAVKSAVTKTIGSLTVRTVSAACFIATKLTAFENRGMDDYYHHDIEDIITVVDGRQSLVDEIGAEENAMREFISGRIKEMLGDERFVDALPGHLGGDAIGLQRLPKLMERLNDIAALGGTSA